MLSSVSSTHPSSLATSSSEEAVEYESRIRFDLKTIDLSSCQNQLIALSRLLKHYISDDVANRRPLLRAMRDHVLVSLSTASAHADELLRTHNGNSNHWGTEEERRHELEKTASESGKNGRKSYMKQDQLDLRTVALQALDSFVAVNVIGARSKASAFFDKLVRETAWFRVALVAGSSVAEAGFLAVNSWGMKKTLTVIDVGPSCPGQELANRLASQTQAPVRYVPLSAIAAAEVFETVDVVLMGAREVLMNGNVVVDAGGGYVAQAAQEAGVPVVIATQAIKVTERFSTDWYAFDTDGDVLKAREIQSIVTELDTNSWRATFTTDILKKMSG